MCGPATPCAGGDGDRERSSRFGQGVSGDQERGRGWVSKSWPTPFAARPGVRLPQRFGQIGGEARFAHAFGIAALPSRRQHDEQRVLQLRIGFDRACERFSVRSRHFVIENCEMERIIFRQGGAQKVEAFLRGGALRIAQVPMIQPFAQDKPIGELSST
jgi:hypothetical protein